ncbi:hypothetical protein [Photorhabdus hindustanensis]|uniref:hypothetical protein n=1 Tax=Photorhabdus hindustanensis TaxID=2918802 RepID=UPI002000E613|nr:hypothetical protein [Photorhabdus hindustanensis]
MPDRFDDTFVIPTLAKEAGITATPPQDRVLFSASEIEIDKYDVIIVCMSGGKDSIASLLRLIDIGGDLSRVEPWYHDVDGREGSSLMDWPFMADYNRKIAEAFGLPLYFSWLEGEMLKNNEYSRAHKIETPAGLITAKRNNNRSSQTTRMRFPQQSPSLLTRWCSSALKIDVGRRALTNQDRFNGRKGVSLDIE